MRCKETNEHTALHLCVDAKFPIWNPSDPSQIPKVPFAYRTGNLHDPPVLKQQQKKRQQQNLKEENHEKFEM
jgi:hypothetical protein